MTTPTISPAYTAINNQIEAVDTIISALAIRDTSNHDPIADPTNVTFADGRFLVNPYLLYVKSTLNQLVTITLVGGPTTASIALLGNALTITDGWWIDMYMIPQMMMRYPYVSIRATCTVAPTTGTLTAQFVLESPGPRAPLSWNGNVLPPGQFNPTYASDPNHY